MTVIIKNQPTPSDHEVLTGEPRDPVERTFLCQPVKSGSGCSDLRREGRG